MKFLFPLIALLVVFSLSCDDDPSTPPSQPPVTKTHVIRDVDYVKDTYFLVDAPMRFLGAREEGFEVFLTVTPADLIADPSLLRFPGWAIPDSLGDGQALWTAAAEIKNSGTTSAGLMQEFRPLERGSDYSLIFNYGSTDSEVVGLELAKAVPSSELRTLALRYLNRDNQRVGGTYADYGISASPDTLLFEMIKAPDPRPEGVFASVWALAFRDIYDLGWKNIDPGTLAVSIQDIFTTRPNPTSPEGSMVSYLRIFGLDKYDETGSRQPDGKIDLLWGALDSTHGLLWLPYHVFAPDPDSVNTWTAGAFAFTGQYQEQYDKSKRIYDELLSPIAEQEVHQYVIKATITEPAP